MVERSGPMTCPVDGSILVMSERQSIEIDYCPTCRGVWLDRGELDKIIERGARLLPSAPAAPQPQAPTAPFRRRRPSLNMATPSRARAQRTPQAYNRRRALEELFDEPSGRPASGAGARGEIGRSNSRPLQPRPFVDRHLSAANHQPIVAQLLQHPVDVDGGQPGRVAEIELGDREGEAALLRQTDQVHPHVELADDVRQAGEGRPPPDREDLLALDRGIEQGREPQHPREVRLLFGDPANGLVGNEGDPAARQGADIVVETLQQEAVQVGEIARQVDLLDLALALAQILVAREDAFEDERAVREGRAVANIVRPAGLLRPRDSVASTCSSLRPARRGAKLEVRREPDRRQRPSSPRSRTPAA